MQNADAMFCRCVVYSPLSPGPCLPCTMLPALSTFLFSRLARRRVFEISLRSQMSAKRIVRATASTGAGRGKLRDM